MVIISPGLRDVFEYGADERRFVVTKLVASNAMPKDRNARLNLFPLFEVLAKARGHPLWLEIMRDVRTALKDNPLPIETLKELLGKAA